MVGGGGDEKIKMRGKKGKRGKDKGRKLHKKTRKKELKNTYFLSYKLALLSINYLIPCIFLWNTNSSNCLHRVFTPECECIQNACT